MSSGDTRAIGIARAEMARRGYYAAASWDASVSPLHTAPEPGPTKQIVEFCSGRRSDSCRYAVVIDPLTGHVEEFIDRRHPTPPPQVPPELLRRLKRSNQAMQRTAGRSAFPLSMTSTFNLQPRAPSPAVADLVSR